MMISHEDGLLVGDILALDDRQQLKKDSPRKLVKRFNQPFWKVIGIGVVLPVWIAAGAIAGHTWANKTSGDEPETKLDRTIRRTFGWLCGGAMGLISMLVLIYGFSRNQGNHGIPNKKLVEIATLLLEDSDLPKEKRLKAAERIISDIYNAKGTIKNSLIACTLDKVLMAINARDADLFNRVANGQFCADDIRAIKWIIKGYFFYNRDEWQKVMSVYGTATNYDKSVIGWIDSYACFGMTTENVIAYNRARADYIEKTIEKSR